LLSLWPAARFNRALMQPYEWRHGEDVRGLRIDSGDDEARIAKRSTPSSITLHTNILRPWRAFPCQHRLPDLENGRSRDDSEASRHGGTRVRMIISARIYASRISALLMEYPRFNSPRVDL
jgi:hypothetical protein